MKTKQRAIKVYYNNNGCWGYNDLIKALSEGWLVKRMDHLYDMTGKVASNVYILEKEYES